MWNLDQMPEKSRIILPTYFSIQKLQPARHRLECIPGPHYPDSHKGAYLTLPPIAFQSNSGSQSSQAHTNPGLIFSSQIIAKGGGGVGIMLVCNTNAQIWILYQNWFENLHQNRHLKLMIWLFTFPNPIYLTEIYHTITIHSHPLLPCVPPPPNSTPIS